jgi:hypothetical protein
MGFSTSNFPVIVNRIFPSPPLSNFWYARYQIVNDWVLQIGYSEAAQIESTSEFNGYDTFYELLEDIASATIVLPANRVRFDTAASVPAEMLAITDQQLADLYTTNPSFPGFDTCDKIASLELARRFFEHGDLTLQEWQNVLKNAYPAQHTLPEIQAELDANVLAGNITQQQADAALIFITS